MAVVKNKSTDRNREFWDYVERLAAKVRTNPQVFTGVQTDHGDTYDVPHKRNEGTVHQENNGNNQ